MVILLCFLAALIYGISSGDLICIIIGGIPFVAGTLIFTINTINERQIQKRRDLDPEFDRFMRDHERRFGKKRY